MGITWFAHSFTILATGFLLLISCSLDPLPQQEISEAQELPFLGETSWIRSFGGSGEDSFHSVINTSDGGFAALGSSSSTDGDLQGKELAVSDYWLVKFSPLGEIEWSKTYGGSKDDRGQAVIRTADGGYAITGYAMSDDGDGSNNEGFHDNWIIKVDEKGTLQWEKSFGFAGHDHSYDIIQTADGGFFFVGFLDVTAANGEGNSVKFNNLTRHGVGEFWGTKIDSNGELQWRRYFGGTNNDRAHAVVESHSGGYIMAGFAESNDFDISNTRGSYDFWVVKVSVTGELLWEHSYGGAGIEIAYDIARTKDQAYVVVGNTFSSDTDVSENHGESDVWMIKINDDGELLWEATFGGSEFDAAQGVSVGSDGAYIISGNSRSTDGDATGNNGENDLWLLKVNTEGDLLWEEHYGGTGLDLGFMALETSDRDLLMVGETGSTDFGPLLPKGDKDALVIRVASGRRYRN